MKTILYSVSTGYIARNLLRTGVIEKLLEAGNRIVIVTPGSDDADFIKEFSFSGRIFIEKMHDDEIMARQKSKFQRSYDFMDRLIWKAWLLGNKYKCFRRLYYLFMKIQIRKRYYAKFHGYYGKIFDKYRPDLVIGASVGIYTRRDIPVYAEARMRGIKVLLLIHSWDNISKRKGPMWFNPDILGAWNEPQKKEAMEFHFYRDSDVKLVGPPHFDIYWKKETFIHKEDLFRKLGLDINKKLITMIATCPGLVKNSYIVDILLDALRKNKFAVPVQLLCRPTPSIDPKWNDVQFGRFYNDSDIVVDRQVQHSSGLGWKPGNDQLYHFANLLRYSDVMVNIASTAVIEAAILDRPVIMVAFSTIQPNMFNKHIINSVFKHHFKVVVNSGAAYIAKDADDLIAGINMYLLNPSIHTAERDNLKRSMVYNADGKASERISALILKLLK